MRVTGRVLIVDDDPAFAAELEATLVARWLQVVVAKNKIDAQQIARVERLDLVVLGTVAPQGEAFRLHHWLKSTPRSNKLPLIVVDAAPENRFIKGWRRWEGMMLEAEDYLAKPVEFTALALRVERLLRRVGERITVLVVDDHAVVRDGIRALLGLQEDIQVVGEAVDGREALEKVRRLSPDVVLMDIAMPVMDGLEAARRINGECPDSRVLMLTQYDDEANVLVSRQVGALGFISKTNASSQLLVGIRSASQGRPFDRTDMV